MQITVTADHLREAERRNEKIGALAKDAQGKRFWHNWDNPIALAIEQMYGEGFYASVSPDRVTIMRRSGREQWLPVNGEIEIFIREWQNGIAQPHEFNIGLLASSQF